MATKKKMLQAAAGNAGGEALNVEDVFSTYLYDGTGSAQTITNGIDLDGEGGAILTKRRDSSSGSGPWFNDTERGITKYISTSDTGTGGDSSASISAVTSSGYTLGGSFSGWNNSAGTYASWTFRKAPKFFTCLTYTGDGTAGRTISHNLGSAPGMIVVKKTSSSTNSNWIVYHKSITASKYGKLNSTDAFTTSFAQYYWGNGTSTVDPTSTEFTVGDTSNLNGSGETYVAYLFAHNDGDGEFGSEADQDIIKCGSYTGGGDVAVDVGFEPQWVLTKATGLSQNWTIHDTMRGYTVDATGQATLHPNVSDAEDTGIDAALTSTGFRTINSSTGQNYIYIAIRRGTKVPESATEVFNVDYQGTNGSVSYSPFAADFLLDGYRNGNSANARARPRLTGGFMTTSSTAAELDAGATGFDQMDGWRTSGSVNSTVISWVWKRAPGFFDAVAFSGDGVAGRTVSHNLGVAPEMVILKNRSGTGNWATVQTNVPTMSFLNATTQGLPSSLPFTLGDDSSYIAPTSDVITVASGYHASSINYIAYLFASLPGISKVFSVTKSSGSDASVNCVFSSGPRFVMLKRTDSTGDWYIWDTERGIVAGNDPYLLLNSTAAEVTSTDYIDPTSNGFTIVNGGLADGDYIGYAVA